MNEQEIRERIHSLTRFPATGRLNIVTDTTEFMRIGSGDLLDLGGQFYLVRGEEVEGRFGLDGEPKFWVKKAVDLANGSPKVIKLVFHESFCMNLGEERIRCIRSPQKEARILEKVRGDLSFMQGITVADSAGNPVRIIDRVQGRRFYDFIHSQTVDHRTYFQTVFPGVFANIVGCVEAIQRLHRNGELHGDVRNDHIIIERNSGIYTWIDFDYTYEWSENHFGVDLFGLGNVLLFATGMGFHNLPDLSACGPQGMEVVSCLAPSDLSLFFKHRIINLQKLFSYIPDSLNHVLLHFSQGAAVFYTSTRELLDDLYRCLPDIGSCDNP